MPACSSTRAVLSARCSVHLLQSITRPCWGALSPGSPRQRALQPGPRCGAPCGCFPMSQAGRSYDLPGMKPPAAAMHNPRRRRRRRCSRYRLEAGHRRPGTGWITTSLGCASGLKTRTAIGGSRGWCRRAASECRRAASQPCLQNAKAIVSCSATANLCCVETTLIPTHKATSLPSPSGSITSWRGGRCSCSS